MGHFGAVAFGRGSKSTPRNGRFGKVAIDVTFPYIRKGTHLYNAASALYTSGVSRNPSFISNLLLNIFKAYEHKTFGTTLVIPLGNGVVNLPIKDNERAIVFLAKQHISTVNFTKGTQGNVTKP